MKNSEDIISIKVTQDDHREYSRSGSFQKSKETREDIAKSIGLQQQSFLFRLKDCLQQIFEDGVAGDSQYKAYQILKLYLSANESKFHVLSNRDDRKIILDNLRGQKWFKLLAPGSKSVMERLVEQMKIDEYYCHADLQSKIMNMTVNFNKFQLIVRYYQCVNDLIQLQIYVSSQKKKNYMAYYVKGRIIGIPEHIKSKLDVPELDDLHQTVDINESMIGARILLHLFLEIILYYDQTESIGKLKLLESHQSTIEDILAEGGNMTP